jgi:hypothetical protein
MGRFVRTQHVCIYASMHTHTRVCVCVCVIDTHIRTHARTHARARARTHTHTHTHTQPATTRFALGKALEKLGQPSKARSHFQAAAAVFALRLGGESSLAREAKFRAEQLALAPYPTIRDVQHSFFDEEQGWDEEGDDEESEEVEEEDD